MKLHSFLSLNLEAGKWLASRHDRFTTRELTTPVSNEWEAVWALRGGLDTLERR